MSVDERVRSKVWAPARPAGVIEMLDASAAARREIGGEVEGDLPSLEKLLPLPRPGDPYTLAFARTPQPVMTLRLLQGNGTNRGFAYHNLDSVDWVQGEKPGDGPYIVLRFDGLTPTEALLGGRHVDQLYDLLGHHRVSWVRELPPGRDFKEPDETVINRIYYRPVQPIQR